MRLARAALCFILGVICVVEGFGGETHAQLLFAAAFFFISSTNLEER